jgi:SPP1 family phage portal protein
MAKWFDWLKERALVALELSEKEILEIEIGEHVISKRQATMIAAEKYYNNETDIINKKQDVDWKNNAQLRLGLFRKIVDQKTGYLLAKEPTIMYGGDDQEDVAIKEALDKVFDESLLKEIKAIGREAIIKGIAYGIPYYDETGTLRLYKVPSQQIIPFYADERRTIVDAFLRIYPQVVYKIGGKKETEIHVEYWDGEGIKYYKLKQGKLVENSAYKGVQPHFRYKDEQGQVHSYNWERVPLVVFKYNEQEQSLLEQVKSIIDNIEMQASVNADLLADIPKFIYILKGYGGEELETFLSQLNLYKVIKIRDGGGGVDKLQADIKTESVESEIARNRKMLYEASRAIDTQDENLGNASGQALKWRYLSLDLDANDFENELQASIRLFMWFVANDIKNKTGREVDLEKFRYIFNRDTITNESEAIQDARNSIGILDARTIREQHPWYSPEVEERLAEEEEKAELVLGYDFGHSHDHPPEEDKEPKEKE